MPSIHLLAVLAAAPFQIPAGYVSVFEAQGDARVAFVHVESEVPLRLGVYSARGQLASWSEPPGSSPPSMIQLQPHQGFSVDPHGNLLGISSYDYDCMQDASASGLAQSTTLSFPKPFADQLHPPWDAPSFAIAPPSAVSGARFVHLGAQARLIAFAARGLEGHRPQEVRVFRRLVDESPVYIDAGDYIVRGAGEIQSSAIGNVLVQAEDGELRLIAPASVAGGEVVEHARQPLDGPFQLSADGRWLAICGRDRVRFLRLGPNGAPLTFEFAVVTLDPAIQVGFAGRQAVILERQRLLMVDLDQAQPGQVLEKEPTQTAKQGSYSSATLVPFGQGRVAVAVGRLEVVRPPARRDGAFVPGLARVYADVATVPPGLPLPTHAANFEVSRWDHDMPRVRFVGDPPRMLVVASQRVLLSPEVTP